MSVRLGKIQEVRVGMGGYQEAMFGVGFTLGGEGWGVGDWWGFWSPSHLKWTEHCKWTEQERLDALRDTFVRLDALMKDAKVTDSAKLKGVPVEVTIEENTLKRWRILSEVL